ncbi:DNA-binding protein [Philodulcilactobacillus myokoensis]|uniref:DNA-binding protein n=1 Tax=Philodulcilactobacillus myokoensis TaxID=2929573 RepID=A0A9W6B1Z1_9LACO|nr:NYN domain-containing protein [Philodulcilactobacillus myokoensis]GLB47178.1 DNA-binding protein [Philodulcilactobacillus myokoensis]
MKTKLYIIDAYNIIGNWPHLNRLKLEDRMADARDELLDTLSEYQKYSGLNMIVVFDAYYVPGLSKKAKYNNLDVVWTSKDQTADSYIEALTKKKQSRLVQVVVVTSDNAEQWTVFSSGALRIPDREFLNMINISKREIKSKIDDYSNQTTVRKLPWSSKQLSELERLRDRLSNKNHRNH